MSTSAPRSPRSHASQGASYVAPIPTTSRAVSSHAPPSSSSKPIHGNYLGYYHKRRFSSDERLALIPLHWLQGKVVLDVGCNAGVVDIEIAQRFNPKSVVGVDIDEVLVKLAQQQGPL